MKKILIVAPYCSLPGEPNFNRFLYIYLILSKIYDVTLVTSDFRHFDKKHRDLNLDYAINVAFIHEPGYKSNVSLSRIVSHKVFTNNFSKWLDKNFDFDLVYSAYPLIETNIILANLKKKYDFKLVIDVQDIWPESISSAFPVINKLDQNLLPFTKKANKAYSSADAIIAVSNQYLNRAISVNANVPSETIFIGSDFDLINMAKADCKDNSIFKLIYIGTLSYSYDVKTIILAINEMVKIGLPIEFHIFGSGEFENELKKIASQAVIFHGFVELSKVFSFMKSSDVAVNALSSSAKQSVTNKFSDFMSIGIPILNSQKSEEILELLDTIDHENYEAGNVESAMDKIMSFYNRRNTLKFSPNEKFNREVEYVKIVNMIDGLINEI
ncbi:MAG: glycosyltransferase involved in cell wall biosynthesis [Oleiphilaceae bacterium]|jgi:glycosyltransferase involved in cell wall biosynthesis